MFAATADAERLLWSWQFGAADDPGLLALLADELAFWLQAGFERVESETARAPRARDTTETEP